MRELVRYNFNLATAAVSIIFCLYKILMREKSIRSFNPIELILC
jgi:hypothetical protein